MISREQAQEQLQSFVYVDVLARRLAALAALPSALATLGRTALGCDFSGNPWRHTHLQRQAEVALGPGLDALAPADRQRLFAALFPRFAAAVEAAWLLGQRLPYQGGYGRRGFRAPGLPAATQAARAAWLIHLAQITLPYEQDLPWFAAWTPYLAGWGPDTLGILFAAALDAGGLDADELFAVLTASARGEHPIGAMGRHVTRALLVAARPDGWAFVERLLLAAQREEGLRQAILETVDEAHPIAFRRMLRLIVDHDLARFTATVRALNVWLGVGWDSANVRAVNAVLAQVLACLESPHACALALESPEAQTVYLALWTRAFADAPAAVPVAARLLNDPVVARRFVAAHLLGQLALPAAWRALLPVLDDQAGKALAKWKIVADEAAQLEALLTRKGAPLRRGVLDLLRRQPDAAVLESAERLLAARYPRGWPGWNCWINCARRAGPWGAGGPVLTATPRGGRGRPPRPSGSICCWVLTPRRSSPTRLAYWIPPSAPRPNRRAWPPPLRAAGSSRTRSSAPPRWPASRPSTT
jgi:hypothetical protein